MSKDLYIFKSKVIKQKGNYINYIYIRILKRFGDIEGYIKDQFNDKMWLLKYYENDENIYLLIKYYNDSYK